VAEGEGAAPVWRVCGGGGRASALRAGFTNFALRALGGALLSICACCKKIASRSARGGQNDGEGWCCDIVIVQVSSFNSICNSVCGLR